jgi:hypothetical protein
MKKTLSKYPYIGLLNFEGDVLRAYRTGIDTFVIVDEHHNFVNELTAEQVREFSRGERTITVANGRTWNYLNEHKNAKPDYDKLEDFLMGK